MILETIVSTVGAAGGVHFAPMGIVDEGGRLLLRPFRETRTWANLKEIGEGVVNFTDNVLTFARCALGDHVPPHHAAGQVRGCVLDDVCHWKEVRVEAADLGEERGRFWARVVAEGRGRSFAGLNRAKHAVIEGTIAVTRVHLLGRDVVLAELDRLRSLVDKTGGPEETAAFAFLIERMSGASGAR